MRTAERPEFVPEQLFSNAVPGRIARIPNGNVDVAGIEVQDDVRTNHFERDIGMSCSPARETWHKPAAGKGIRRRHAKRLAFAIALYCGYRRGKGFEPVANNREEARARVGHGHWAWTATEERAPAITFEQADLVTDRSRRDAELGCGLLETQVPS